MRSKRRVYSAKFKNQVAMEAIKERQTLRQLAEKHQLHANQISTWKQTIIQNSQELFDKKRGRKSKKEEELIARLYQQIGELQVELTWLKKKVSL